MNSLNIATRSYVPAEIHALRLWLPFAVLVTIIIAGLEVLRNNHGAALIALLLALLLGLTRWQLPDGKNSWKRPLAQALAAVSLSIGALNLVTHTLSLYDIWASCWLTIPAGLVVYWLFIGPVSSWSSGRLNERMAEKGLARNRRTWPRLEAVGLHTLLIHAISIVVIPVIWIMDISISPGNILGGAIGDAFTLEHYSSVLGGKIFWVWTLNSLVVACGTTLFGLMMAVPAGYAFSRWDFAGRKGSMFAFMLIQMFPGIIILVPYFMVMKTLGLLNTSLGLIVVYSVTALPLCVWMLKGFFDSVPRALEEAALLDGCTQVEVFFRIVLPLSLPAVAMTALFSFLTAWNEYLLALVFNTSNEQYTLPVGLASMIPTTGQQWGDFAAASIVVSIPVVFLFVMFQKALIQGLSAGSVKG